MPLEKGSSKEVIGHNIEEMEKSGHPHKQAVAAALHTAYDGEGEEKKDHLPLQADSEPEYRQAGPPGMSLSEIQKRNSRYWTQQGGEFKENL